jgi:hypothetical protein
MKSLNSLMIAQKGLKAELELLKVQMNLRKKVTKRDMEKFEKLIKKGEPIFKELEAYEGYQTEMPEGIETAIAGFRQLKQQTEAFYKATRLCKDNVYRTPEEMKALKLKG